MRVSTGGTTLAYFKRFRMERELPGRSLPPCELPLGYGLQKWRDDLLEAHAVTKSHCFRGELDGNVFPCLRDLEGCLRLMTDIRAKPGFLPGGTWLATYQRQRGAGIQYVGTVQAIIDPNGFGAVQNLGIVPQHRGLGLGAELMRRALLGFMQAGLKHCYLEVTAQNTGAIRLYERLGFRMGKILYKAVELDYVEA
jgi:ribosomal protein S18 acetylase RimI-like enzyme